jgi:hypothetical protein
VLRGHAAGAKGRGAEPADAAPICVFGAALAWDSRRYSMNTHPNPDEEKRRLERGIPAQKSELPQQEGEPLNKSDEGGPLGPAQPR